MSLLVPVAALADKTRADGRPDAIISRGRTLIPLLAAALASDFVAGTRALGAGSIATIAARALDLDDSAIAILDVALVVLADHELNASSFAARVAASTEADPYACISAALATVSGPRHGSAAEAIARFADEVGDPDEAATVVRTLRRKGGSPPGFGHQLYPDGDPRATPLLAQARQLAEISRVPKRARTILAMAEHAKYPTVDVGLAALVAALGAQPSAGTGLFALARSAGWLAHVIEQRGAGFLLRPRARYTGVPVT
jgi:citrate synthase